MGVPIPGPTTDACDACDGILWPPGASSVFATATFTDIEACLGAPAPAPNFTFLLRQPADAPCVWEYYGTIYWVEWVLGIGFEQLRVGEVNTMGKWYFKASHALDCNTTFINEYLVCGPVDRMGKLGTGIIVPL